MAKLRISEWHGIVPNTILNNPWISLKVQWLYAYIQSKPNWWDFSAVRIAKAHTDWIDSVKAWLKSLESIWLLTRTKIRLRSGLRDREYCLHATSQILTKVENPPMDKPPMVKPSTDNPPIKKTRNSKQDIVNNNKNILSKDNIYEQSSSEKINDDFLPGENEVISTTPLPPSGKKEFGDPGINECLDIIKKYNDWVLNWSKWEQRIFAKHLITKVSEMPKVISWSMTWQVALNNILLRVSNNQYHSSKIWWPEIIFKNFWTLIQVAKTTAPPSPKSNIENYIDTLPADIKDKVIQRWAEMSERVSGKKRESIDQIKRWLETKGIKLP